MSKKHEHHSTSNTPEVFSSCIGCTVKGIIHQERGTTLVFQCGWGLTFNHEHGSYWSESPEEVERLLYESKRALIQTKRELEDILHLAGDSV